MDTRHISESLIASLVLTCFFNICNAFYRFRASFWQVGVFSVFCAILKQHESLVMGFASISLTGINVRVPRNSALNNVKCIRQYQPYYASCLNCVQLLLQYLINHCPSRHSLFLIQEIGCTSIIEFIACLLVISCGECLHMIYEQV